MYLSALDDDGKDAFVSLRKHCAEYFAVEIPLTKIQAETKTRFLWSVSVRVATALQIWRDWRGRTKMI
jgi:hypothetical protein